MELIILLLIPLFFIIGEFLGVALLSVPGAFIRWLFLGRKKPFKEFLKEPTKLNAYLGFITVLVLYIATALVLKLF